MRICPAEAERVHPGGAESVDVRKRFVLHGDAEFQPGEVDVRIRILEMQTGGNPPVLEDQRSLDQASHTGRGFQVTEIGFHRADH